MNTSQANDKLIPPVMEEVVNIETARRGRARKIYGYDDISVNASADVQLVARINAIAPITPGDLASTILGSVIVIGDGEFYGLDLLASTWSAWSIVAPGDSYPWNIAWGINASGVAVVYFARNNVFACRNLGTATKYGTGAPWTIPDAVEFHLDKLFVANVTVSGTEHNDRVYWSVTGDDNDFTSSGSGFLDVRDPGGGSSNFAVGITGMRVYQNRLYIAQQSSLYCLTGTTSETFGVERITDINIINGATMYVTGGFLFFVDRDGIHQFNGRTTKNIMAPSMFAKWDTLVSSPDIGSATATWDEIDGVYKVFFPNAQELWCYHYRTGQWDIRTFNSTDDVRVVGPPMNTIVGRATNFGLGSLTSGKAWHVNDQVVTDDGGTITGSVTTGNIRLAEMNGGRPGDHARLLYIDIEAVQQDQAGVIKVDITIDGTAQATASLTGADAGGSADTFPTHYDGKPTTRIDLGSISKSGRFFQFKFSDDDANSRMDLRRVTVWYERLENAGSRPS
jgi:hypothetical protein